MISLGCMAPGLAQIYQIQPEIGVDEGNFLTLQSAACQNYQPKPVLVVDVPQ